MSLAEAPAFDALSKSERRRHSRVKINLLGRCMFQDGREFPCQLVDASPGGAAVISPNSGEVGEYVVAYIDHIGRLEGKVVRHIDGGFAMIIEASARKRDKIADKLTWLANRHILNLPEDRRHPRRQPRNSEAILYMAEGETMSCNVMDMSLSGAAVATSARPPLNSEIYLGKIAARVVRHTDSGIAIEFRRVMSEAAIEKAIDNDFS